MALTNPIRLVYDGLWNCLESGDAFLEYFPTDTMHQVRYTTSASTATDSYPDPDLETLNPADYPRCKITFQSGKGKLNANSNQSNLLLRFRIEVCTGLQRQGKMLDIFWEIYRGLTRWFTYLRTQITWEGDRAVVYTDLEDIAATMDDIERNRGTKQWICLFEPVVQLTFNTASLEAT